MAQAQGPHQVGRGFLACGKDVEQAAYLIGYLHVYLFGLNIRQSVIQCLEHEFYEPGGFTLRVRLSQAGVILILPVTDDGFYRHVGQYRLP